MAMLHTNTQRPDQRSICKRCENCTAFPHLPVCLRPFFSVSLLCPYVLTQLWSNQGRLVIYRRLGLRFGMQLWAQQWDHQFHVYTSSCTLIHMQKPLTAHTQRRSPIRYGSRCQWGTLLSSSAPYVCSWLPVLQAGLQAIAELRY